MIIRIGLAGLLAGALLFTYLVSSPVQACCPAPPRGKPVVNADQTVIMIWDPTTQTQHFIRQASFKSSADDFGFLVPTPNQPELEESGNEVFQYLFKLTEPEKKQVPYPSGGVSCSCSKTAARNLPGAAPPPVRVLQEKLVAGFHAVVLETTSATALVNWLKNNDYAFSPEIEAWAKPYVEGGWKITALKVAKSKDGKDGSDVAASALRLTFKTDRPLFPYREPDYKSAAESLGANHRLLRIYFLADARYQGELTPGIAWTGRVAWAGKVNPTDRKKTLELLKLPETTGPADWWLTEFEDDWPYRVVPVDVYFSRSPTQDAVKREPIIEYVSSPWPSDVMVYAIAVVVVAPPLLRRVRRGGNA